MGIVKLSSLICEALNFFPLLYITGDGLVILSKDWELRVYHSHLAKKVNSVWLREWGIQGLICLGGDGSKPLGLSFSLVSSISLELYRHEA